MSRTRLARVLLALGALLGALVVPAAGAPVTAAATEHDGISLELVSTTPLVAGPSATVGVTVRVTNRTEAPVQDLEVDLAAGWRPVASRQALERWDDADSMRTAGTRQATQAVAQLGPGASTEVTLQMDVDGDLQLRSDAPWGPRQVSVAVRESGTPVDVLHTFFLFDPLRNGTEGLAPAEVRLSVLAPVTGPAIDPADPERYTAELGELTAPGGALARTVEAALPAGGGPAVSLAVDPAVAATAATSGSDDALAWAESLAATGAAAGPDVVRLPALDPDLAALAHAAIGDASVRAAATADGATTGWQAPESWGPSVAWPVGVPDVETLAAARIAGAEHVVVEGGLRTEDDEAATGLARVGTPSGDVSAVVADPRLSAVVAAATTATDPADPAGRTRSTAEAAQRLLAETAVMASEAGAQSVTQAPTDGEPVHVVVTLPRGWDPDPAAVTELLTTLEAGGWVDVVPLSELLGRTPPDVEREPLPDSEPAEEELRPAQVRALADARRAVEAYASVAAEPATLAGGVEVALSAPLSLVYRSEPEAREAAAQQAVARAQQLRGGLSVVPRADVALLSASGDLPVRVRNDLPVDATVTVVLRPDDPRLVVETRPTVVVPAGRSVDVPVHVRAIGSGDIDVRVEVLAPSGAPVLEPTTFSVRVRAGWETVGTAVVAAAIGLLFVAGIWRTVRRGRSARRTTGETVAPAATEPTSTEPATTETATTETATTEAATTETDAPATGPVRPRTPEDRTV